MAYFKLETRLHELIQEKFDPINKLYHRSALMRSLTPSFISLLVLSVYVA